MIGFGSALAGRSPACRQGSGRPCCGRHPLLLRRESLDATVASVLVIGAINIVVLVAIAMIGLTT